ncbi:unnamed protein product (macronuclear) [Paramecium tetraurelia]|uniref:protein-serine/threonine phosphatase n=1 Tax=Paramecium tetraurelia TaxID=5888 RepID=A0BNS0_PARTE|nr:uncharacterized protein GSPATT00030826001 [Paramecium tetraurelia]CAK60187.1 unnamed protein product [Paramecium tetraurelia]|eukprot:XP_001427585.1 hypothetical protein (macronuclear) [Paramecium tetraurelia strain d4-2]
MNYRSKNHFSSLNNLIFDINSIKKQKENTSLQKEHQFDVSPTQKKQIRLKKQEINYHSLVDLKQLTRSRNVVLPNYEPTRCSQNNNGLIKAYAANTNQGIIRNYNEDRVSIILNIIKPQHRSQETWPKCAFFGVYDGHGGSTCADFLRDNLHQYVTKQSEFPWNPVAAIKKGFQMAEKDFLAQALEQYGKGKQERSGSCALISLVVGDYCYVANVGDCRAILSQEKGKKSMELSVDHKPEIEYERIQKNGGKIYQTHLINENGIQIVGPYRVFPGRLSVSRTFGDIEAKLGQFGGNENVVIAEPDIQIFRITQENDFIVMGCDGIFDKMKSEEVIKKIWSELESQKNTHNLHGQISAAVDSVLKEVVLRKSSDNITLLIIAFNELVVQQQTPQSKINSISNQIELLQIFLKNKINDENQPEFNQKKQSPVSQLFHKAERKHLHLKENQETTVNRVRSSFNF